MRCGRLRSHIHRAETNGNEIAHVVWDSHEQSSARFPICVTGPAKVAGGNHSGGAGAGARHRRQYFVFHLGQRPGPPPPSLSAPGEDHGSVGNRPEAGYGTGPDGGAGERSGLEGTKPRLCAACLLPAVECEPHRGARAGADPGLPGHCQLLRAAGDEAGARPHLFEAGRRTGLQWSGHCEPRFLAATTGLEPERGGPIDLAR